MHPFHLNLGRLLKFIEVNLCYIDSVKSFVFLKNSCDKVVPDAGPTVHLPASRNVCTESSHTLDVELQLPGKISNKGCLLSMKNYNCFFY